MEDDDSVATVMSVAAVARPAAEAALAAAGGDVAQAIASIFDGPAAAPAPAPGAGGSGARACVATDGRVEFDDTDGDCSVYSCPDPGSQALTVTVNGASQPAVDWVSYTPSTRQLHDANGWLTVPAAQWEPVLAGMRRLCDRAAVSLTERLPPQPAVAGAEPPPMLPFGWHAVFSGRKLAGRSNDKCRSLHL